ncbi:MAG: rod shape-determining protein MreC [Bacteroidota bacterium]|nr:rod shape-determining protein MreC [Candidatus Kapabacteria bacterium]MDW8220522.1 rod shape-determining protein MreC [Bacteroidota bacterium]
MIRIVEILVRFKEYVVLCILVAISFLLMSFGNTAKLRGLRVLVISGVGVVQEAFAWIPNPLTILSDNAALREANYRLSRELAYTRRAVAENQRLRALLEFRDSIHYPVRPARVVGRVMDKARYYLTLNVGTLDSIAVGMPVVNDKGLVGFVYSTVRHHAVVQTILDKETRIAAVIQRNRTNGIVVWEGGTALYLTNIAKTEDVQEGDIVVTSDYSSRYPPDIIIGKIVEKRDEPTTLFWKLRVEPAVHFPSLEYVFVGLQPPDEERILVEELLEKNLGEIDASRETSARVREAIREANRLSRQSTRKLPKELERPAVLADSTEE